MAISAWQIILVVLLVVLLFGRGKISAMMGDVAQGIKSFKKGMKDDDGPSIEHSPTETVSEDAKDKTKVG
ncbi:MAG: twin-arginine translocase TatA/TatE family subunit [Pseudomonadota bacterium]